MGIYINGITVEMFRNAPLEAVEELMAEGQMIDVPEPHGRLIDADKLLGECKPRGIADDVWEESNEYKQIINAPTIIESEVEE